MASREKLIKLELRALDKPKITQSHCIFHLLLSRPRKNLSAWDLMNCARDRVAELGSLSSGAKTVMKIFVKRVFTIFATNASLRGAKTQNFPDSSFLRAKTFQTKCAKPFLKTRLKSAFLPL